MDLVLFIHINITRLLKTFFTDPTLPFWSFEDLVSVAPLLLTNSRDANEKIKINEWFPTHSIPRRLPFPHRLDWRPDTSLSSILADYSCHRPGPHNCGNPVPKHLCRWGKRKQEEKRRFHNLVCQNHIASGSKNATSYSFSSYWFVCPCVWVHVQFLWSHLELLSLFLHSANQPCLISTPIPNPFSHLICLITSHSPTLFPAGQRLLRRWDDTTLGWGQYLVRQTLPAVRVTLKFSVQLLMKVKSLFFYALHFPCQRKFSRHGYRQ